MTVAKHVRLPKERITLEEAQALIQSKTQGPAIASRFAVIFSFVAMVVSLLGFVVAVVR